MARRKDYLEITESDVTTSLGKDIYFKGNLTFKTSLMIKGRFEGEIDSEGILIIDKSAKVKAQIKTNTLVCYGEIQGNITAERSVVFCEGSNYRGNIQTPDIIIESGAIFNGVVKMDNQTQPQKEDV